MPITNPFSSSSPGLTSPAQTGYAITPADGSDLAVLPRGIYVGGAGSINCTMLDASGAATDVVFTGCVAGTILPIRPTRVKSTSTTATGLIALV